MEIYVVPMESAGFQNSAETGQKAVKAVWVYVCIWQPCGPFFQGVVLGPMKRLCGCVVDDENEFDERGWPMMEGATIRVSGAACGPLY